MENYEYFRTKPVNITDMVMLSKSDFDNLLKYEYKFYQKEEDKTRMFKALTKLVLYYKHLANDRENIETTYTFLENLSRVYNFELEFVKTENYETLIGKDLKQ